MVVKRTRSLPCRSVAGADRELGKGAPGVPGSPHLAWLRVRPALSVHPDSQVPSGTARVPADCKRPED